MPRAADEGLDRILDREQRDADLLANSLLNALALTRQIEPAASPELTDPLTRVVARVSAVLKANPPVIDEHAEGLETESRLSRLLTSADLASRKVSLSNRWWETGRAAMVAWTKSGQPLALWPIGRSGYAYYEAESDRTGRVDTTLAGTLKETARAVYPTLLQDKVRFNDLLATGLHGTGQDLFFTLLFGVVGALVGLLTPSITATLINIAIPESAQRMVVELTTILVSVAIIVAVFQFLQATALLRAQTIFEANAQAALWHRLMRMPSEFFRKFDAANLALRVMGLSQIRTVLSQGITTAVLGGIFSSVNFVVMIVYGGWLTAVALVMTILTIVVALLANVAKVRRLRNAIAAHDNLAGLSAQIISAIKKIRVAGADTRILARLISMYNLQRRYKYDARLIENFLRAFNAVIPLLSTAAFFAAIEFWLEEPPSTGNFVAFAAAYGSFIVGITGLINSLIVGLVAVVLYERLKPVLEASPERAVGAVPPGTLSGHIELDGVTFRYHPDGPVVLDNISLTIEPGQFVAIVGPSGSGKSTLFRLLLGFEQPQSGSILYDGKDLSRLDIIETRQQFGVVLQNTPILGGSILENIVGMRGLTLDDAWKAAERASLAQDIRAMPMQMHTFIGDGATISGGERQRLMIARALAGLPRILFMDEATSALDNATQAAITETLSSLDFTRVVIAHRLSTVKDADIIYVMQHGRIVESGDAVTLLKIGGVFSELAERQLS